MNSVCVQCQWKALTRPSRDFVRGVVIRRHQPTLHFDRYQPVIEPTEANGVKHNRITWKLMKPLGQPIGAERMAELEKAKYTNRKGRGKRLAAYSARGKNPDRAHPLHFLRAMLRECTYLPDPLVRREMKAYIIDRFRRKSKPSQFEGPVKEAHTKLAGFMARARRGLTYLQRATMARIDEYTRTLLMAYGRVGKRRHILLSQIREADRQDSSAYNYIEEVIKAKNIQFPPDTKLPVIGPRMYALLKSQSNQRGANTYRTGAVSRGLQPKIPETNSWGRKMPKSRVKNKFLDWHNKLLEGVLPPLPEEEYTRLGALASGADRSLREIPRRVAARDHTNDTGSQAATDRARKPERKVSEKNKLFPYRFMRRRLQLVFQLCPLLTMGPDGRWRVTWTDVEYRKNPAPDEPGSIVERDEINPRDDPRALNPIREATEDIENDSPEGDASKEIREFMEFFDIKHKYAPSVPGQNSEDIVLPHSFYKKVDRLISGPAK